MSKEETGTVITLHRGDIRTLEGKLLNIVQNSMMANQQGRLELCNEAISAINTAPFEELKSLFAKGINCPDDCDCGRKDCIHNYGTGVAHFVTAEIARAYSFAQQTR